MMVVQQVNRTAGGLVTGTLIAVLIMGAVGILALVDQTRQAMGRGTALSYLPKGQYLKVAVLGYRQLAADMLWLQVVQQIGVLKQTKEGYLWMSQATDTLTDLDPKFAYGYQAVGSVLGVWGNRPHEAAAILRKGIEHNPEAWELPFFLGYVYFYELQDFASAATYLKQASELPGAPEYLPRLTARMMVQAGDPQAALEFLQRMLQQARDDRAKEALEKRIADVTVERDLRILEEGIRRYQAVYGRSPARLQDLLTSNILLRLPVDPGGGSYELEADGAVRSTRLPQRMRVYRSS
jgi:tetratricopeptide (TPR) repeat protein